MEFGKSNTQKTPLKYSMEASDSAIKSLKSQNQSSVPRSNAKVVRSALVISFVVLQVLLLFFVFRIHSLISEPVTKDLKIIGVLNNLSKVTNIPPASLPNQANIIGDGTLPKIEELRKLGPIQSEVFKDARDGDYVLVYAGSSGTQDRLIVFRDTENRVIYDGKTVASIDQENRNALLNQLVEVVKNAGLISRDSTEVPNAQVVADAVKFREENDIPFFQDVQNGDIIAIFRPRNGEALTVIYRPASNIILKTGTQTIRQR